MHTFRSIFALVLIGLLCFGALGAASAQDAAAQHFVVMAGAGGPGNLDVLAFAPSVLKVHRGDTVTWNIAGFHNVHFEAAMASFAIFPEGQPPALNPEVAFPSIENGGSFTGEPVNSGLPLDPNLPPVFTLVIDAEPGTYVYFCDIHPGMSGIIEVVPDDEAIPSPTEAFLGAAGEVGQHVGAGMNAFREATAAHADHVMAGAEGATVQMGANDGAAYSQNFFPEVVVITAGQSVTWVLAEGHLDPHTVTDVPAEEIPDIIPQTVDGGPPVLQFGPGFLGITANGAEIGAEGGFHSGLVLPPDGTFTLTFTEPGVFPYRCNLHLGMTGTVVVLPA